jgi:hypothetical protein
MRDILFARSFAGFSSTARWAGAIKRDAGVIFWQDVPWSDLACKHEPGKFAAN